MIKIGFIDYFLDEWHANKYPAWFREASEKLGEELAVSYAWAELDAPPAGGKDGSEEKDRGAHSAHQPIRDIVGG